MSVRYVLDEFVIPQEGSNSPFDSSIPSYEPSSTVTMMWTAFGVQCIATLYILSRGVILPDNARTFHRIFVLIGVCSSLAYLLEAGALEYIDLLHDEHLSAGEHASAWRLPCNTPDIDLDSCEDTADTPMCAIIPYYFSRIIIQSLMVYGIAFLAGTPRREHIAAITCVALMECCNFSATLLKSLYESITLMMVWSFGLRLFLMIPLVYFLLHGIEHNIRRAPIRVRGVCHGWCCMMVILQFWNLIVWCLAYGTKCLSLFSLLGCRVVADMVNTVVIPLLVLRDTQLILLVRDRDERVGALSKIHKGTFADLSVLTKQNLMQQNASHGGFSMTADLLRDGCSVGVMNYKDRVLLGEQEERYHSHEDSYGYDDLAVRSPVNEYRPLPASKESTTTARSLNDGIHPTDFRIDHDGGL